MRREPRALLFKKQPFDFESSVKYWKKQGNFNMELYVKYINFKLLQ